MSAQNLREVCLMLMLNAMRADILILTDKVAENIS
jgi:hypothetical protein